MCRILFSFPPLTRCSINKHFRKTVKSIHSDENVINKNVHKIKAQTYKVDGVMAAVKPFQDILHLKHIC